MERFKLLFSSGSCVD